MSLILKIFDTIYSLGFIVVLPVLLAAVGLVLGLGPGRSLRSGAATAAALFGVNLIVNRVGIELLSATQLIAEKYGLAPEVVNLQYSASSSLAFGSRVNAYVIPACLLLNLLLVLIGCCRTFDIDVWNLWHVSFIGALVESLTGSFLYGILSALIGFVFILIVADMSSSSVERATGVEGVTIANPFAMAYAPVAWGVNRLIDLIPGSDEKPLTFSVLARRYGVLGEPALWGAVIGAALGVIAGQDVYGVLQLAAVCAVALILIPTAGRLLVRGLSPITGALNDRVNARGRTKGRFSIGLSTALGMTDPTVIVVTLVLVPLALLFGTYLPGVRMLPVDDVAMLMYIVMAAVMLSRGRLVRSLVSGLVAAMVALWCGSGLAELFTQAARALDYDRYGQLGIVNTLADGASPLAWAEVQAAAFGTPGFALMILVLLVMLTVNRNRIAAEHKLCLVAMGQEVRPVAGDMRHWTSFLRENRRAAAHAEEKPVEKKKRAPRKKPAKAQEKTGSGEAPSAGGKKEE